MKRTPLFMLLLVWATVCLGVVLRTYRADKFPIDNNDDGLFYVWTGNTFLNQPFSPVSHSIFDANNKALIWRSQFLDYDPVKRFGMKIVRPWFDHPPLGSLLIALPAKLLGYTDLEQLPHMLVRYPALIASIFTLILTYSLGGRLFGKRTGFFALVFLATVPYFVFSHRQAYLENFLTPIMLGALACLQQFLETKRKKYIVGVMILSALTGWIKIPAFMFPMMVAGYLFHQKDKKNALIIGVSGIASALAYLAYGFLSNASAFLGTMTNQGVRGAFAGSFYDTLTNPHFYTAFTDGWYVLSLVLCLALLILGKKEKGMQFYNWFLTCWLFTLFLISGRFNNSPWYKYQLIPFMAIALGYYAKRFIEKANIFLFMPFFLFGLMGFELLGVSLNTNLLRIMTIVSVFPFMLRFLFDQSKQIQRFSVISAKIVLVLLIALNVWVSLKYPFIYCQKYQCLHPERVIVGEKK